MSRRTQSSVGEAEGAALPEGGRRRRAGRASIAACHSLVARPAAPLLLLLFGAMLQSA
jgi:hypothetical protein